MRSPEELERQKTLLTKKAIVRVETASEFATSDYEPFFFVEEKELPPEKVKKKKGGLYCGLETCGASALQLCFIFKRAPKRQSQASLYSCQCCTPFATRH